jgi:hypothetical protein
LKKFFRLKHVMYVKQKFVIRKFNLLNVKQLKLNQMMLENQLVNLHIKIMIMTIFMVVMVMIAVQKKMMMLILMIKMMKKFPQNLYQLNKN